MQKTAHWVLDGPIMEDAGDVGGDIQVGPAYSARFRSDDCPESRFEVTVYATAKPYIELGETDPQCPHDPVILERYGDGVARYAPMPEEHLACSFKPGTVDVQEQTTYRMNGHMVDGTYESDNHDPIFYQWVGSDVGYRAEGLPEEIRLATQDAKRHIKDWVANVNTYLYWDGRSEPKG
ncbi:hypothetical protein [Streptomyces sp. 5-10]|uniref:hypothetical protein n=1 Tax=Streptomyces sp. 5-10 TaxID=878925 RepID=UPI00168B50EC|nr:hypothetical protein [Streptomyces sp. 5-10]MBD3004596.1 hypothetical protein [Streptomyces sp. 5-10]